MQRDMDSLRTAIEQVDRGQFEQMVDKLLKAQHIYLLGMRSSSFLTGYLNFLFPPDLQKCDTGAERRGRGDLRAAGAGAAR